MRWFNHPTLEAARAWLKAAVDRLAFLVESACIANAVFWFLTWGLLGFSWRTTAHEWGNFWTHYTAAAPAARQPVEIFLGLSLVALTGITCFIRFPKVRRAWDPWPRRTAEPRPASTAEEEFA